VRTREMASSRGQPAVADSPSSTAVSLPAPATRGPGVEATPVMLLFPPGADPRSPHLAIASLSSYLGKVGIRTIVRDLDIEGLESVLEPTRLEQAVLLCEQRGAQTHTSKPVRRVLDDLLRYRKSVIERTGDALSVLRGERFYDPHEHHYARALIGRALAIVSTASDGVDYAISPPRYDVAGMDPTRLSDLLTVTADPRANLFADLYDDVLAEVIEAQPVIVGVSITNRQQIIPGLTLARRLKEAGHTVVIGGTVYAKFVPELIERPLFFSTFCAALVPYEGESALEDLTRHLLSGGDTRSLGKIANVLSLDDAGRVVAGPTAIESVPALPTPDFSALPLDRYLAPEPVLPILFGKGCYYNRCSFCDIPFINSVSDRPYRSRPADLVVDDLIELHRATGARNFEITDETLSPHALRAFAASLATRAPEIDARFVGYARFEPGFTPETCEQLYAAGFRKLFFGLESGSQATIDHMRKGFKIDVALRTLRNCLDAGIAVHIFSIVGFPEETEDRAQETLQFFMDNSELIGNPACTFDIHGFGLDLRTEYSDNAEHYGIVVDQADLDNRDFPVSVEKWENTRGIGKSRVDELLTHFEERLRSVLRPDRNHPDQQWPGFEEYAVLYGRHYEDRAFSFPLGLPPLGSEDVITLRWNPDVLVTSPDADDGRDRALFRVGTVAGEAIVGETLLRVLSSMPAPGPVSATIDELANRINHQPHQRDELCAELREGLDRLIASRALWIDVGVPGSAPLR